MQSLHGHGTCYVCTGEEMIIEKPDEHLVLEAGRRIGKRA